MQLGNVPDLPSTIQTLGQRHIVQWAIAYVLGAWVLLQVAELLVSIFLLSTDLLRGLVILLVFGFGATLVLAWYHGERGRQRMSLVELALLTAIALIAAGFLQTVRFDTERCGPESSGPAAALGLAETRKFFVYWITRLDHNIA